MAYFAKLFFKDEGGSARLFKHNYFKASDADEAIKLTVAWIKNDKPLLYEANKAELWHGDELVREWSINDLNFQAERQFVG